MYMHMLCIGEWRARGGRNKDVGSSGYRCGCGQHCRSLQRPAVPLGGIAAATGVVRMEGSVIVAQKPERPASTPKKLAAVLAWSLI